MRALALSFRPVLPLALALSPAGAQGPRDEERATFARCEGSGRVTCVVDGDTIWYRGDKIRIADINTSEISRPDCAAEAALGERATTRLTQLLNEGPFSLEREGRDTDRYGRLLRVVSRGGQSLGDILVAEGLAEQWRGRRSGWCGQRVG
ncbi:thermonuclease family protein [Aurantiacibacter spongiae]|uniref:Thermonuclease family protein n=1 Tax=Aurantiacibacter spongiae TaxID=2488860 RepID=A0A3N5CTK7_9SPHN|nr:thermonuclease family protein [Aurantiacibacter spongiae]RPF71636.1 thermonuclease family protein [Aurantiacibacter spongiae]